MAVAVVIGWIWTSALLRSTMETVLKDTRSMALIGEAERSLLLYQRISNLWVAGNESELLNERKRLEVEMRRQLREAESVIESSAGKKLLRQIRSAFDRYIEERRELEQSGLRLREILARTRQSVNAILSPLSALRDLKAEELERMQNRALRVRRTAQRVAGAAALVFVFVSAGVAFGVQRYVLRPVLQLRDAIDDYRFGRSRARAPESATLEMAEIARAFNSMAEELVRQRHQQLTFLAGVAHDLRTPLSTLRMSVVALRQGPVLPSEQRDRQLTIFERQVERMTRMVGDLLDATRVEAGELELHVTRIDLREPVEEMVYLYRNTTSKHEIELHSPSQPVWVLADMARIAQVLSNLLNNAIKYSPEGGTIAAAVHVKNEKHAEVVISDQGIGMSNEQLEDIFLPFRRHATAGHVYPGAGLGLSVAKKIVEAHRGAIDVESEPSKGSTFTVRLPLAREEDSGTAREPL